MLMFIDKIRVFAPANMKCKELCGWVDERFSQCLTDERALERIYEEICNKMGELDEKYPRTRRLRLELTKMDCDVDVYALMSNKGCPDVVFVMYVRNVEARYLWSEHQNIPVYYGRQEEDEYRRACERRKGGRQ